MSLVFVIVPAYNAEAYIQDCLDSLRGQSLTDWQAVVIDDGSTDRTLAVAQQIASREPRIQVASFANGDMAVAKNRGRTFLPSDARYVLHLDSDDFLTPDALETLVDHLERNERAVAAYGLPCLTNQHGEPLSDDPTQAYGFARKTIMDGKLIPAAEDMPTTFANFAYWNPIGTPGQVLIRASALAAIGEFDPAAVPTDDWDMWLRLSSRGDFLFVRQFVMNKRTHGENVSNNTKRMLMAELFVRRKIARCPCFSSELRSLACIGHRFACANQLSWAKDSWKQGNLPLAVKSVYRGVRGYAWFVRTWTGNSGL